MQALELSYNNNNGGKTTVNNALTPNYGNSLLIRSLCSCKFRSIGVFCSFSLLPPPPVLPLSLFLSLLLSLSLSLSVFQSCHLFTSPIISFYTPIPIFASTSFPIFHSSSLFFLSTKSYVLCRAPHPISNCYQCETQKKPVTKNCALIQMKYVLCDSFIAVWGRPI